LNLRKPPIERQLPGTELDPSPAAFAPARFAWRALHGRTLGVIRTKIITTLGPATSTPQTLADVIRAGASVCRLNFSHGTVQDHATLVRLIRQTAQSIGKPVAILGDLCGPKIRLQQVPDMDGTGGLPVAVGENIIIGRRPGEHGPQSLATNYEHFVEDLRIGDRVLIEDGLIRFVCVEKNRDHVVCRCTTAGVLKTAKGVNLPNTSVRLPSITDRDWEFVEFAIEMGLDYLALSFVRSSADLRLLRQKLESRRTGIHIIAKIEKSEAISDIDQIIDAADGLMIARGDLGVEMDLAQVPLLQKDLVRRCRDRAKPVIVATQMLQSMIEAASPTRAEVSDVANAIFDGADAVMLSGETSVGRFPAGTVHVMSHIAETTERYLDAQPDSPDIRLDVPTMPMSAAIAGGVREMVTDLDARVVVVYSQTGATARVFSKHRFPVPVVGLSSDPAVLRRMALFYGVMPVELAPPPDLPTLIAEVENVVHRAQLASRGQRVVIVAGSALGTPGLINGIILHTLSAPSKEL
jgi:pyruvate kinase